jgi:nucleotide-binding universal stress UspA family protein
LRSFSLKEGRERLYISMIQIRRILCPTDLSTNSDQALRYAIAMTRAYDAKLLIGYRPVLGRIASAPLMHASSGQSMFEPALRTFLAPEDANELNWHGLLLEGEDIGDAITSAASEHAADVIVMRSRRRPHRAALLGSTAEAVCRTAPCPVLVTHTDERDWVQPLSKNISIQRVLVPYDFSDYAELALNYALSAAQEYQAELHVLHVLSAQAENSTALSAASPYHTTGLRLQRSVPPEAHLWCNVKYTVSDGHPYREILSYAEHNAIDLISIGAHGTGFGMRTLFGSNVDRVLRQAPCPVLVARPLKPLNHHVAIEPQANFPAFI